MTKKELIEIHNSAVHAYAHLNDVVADIVAPFGEKGVTFPKFVRPGVTVFPCRDVEISALRLQDGSFEGMMKGKWTKIYTNYGPGEFPNYISIEGLSWALTESDIWE